MKDDRSADTRFRDGLGACRGIIIGVCLSAAAGGLVLSLLLAWMR